MPIIDKTKEEEGRGYQILEVDMGEKDNSINPSSTAQNQSLSRRKIRLKILYILGIITRTLFIIFLFWRGITWFSQASKMLFQLWTGFFAALFIISCFAIALILLFRLLLHKVTEEHYHIWGGFLLFIIAIYFLVKLGWFGPCYSLEDCFL